MLMSRQYCERIPEHAITDWRGARVQVTIEVPQASDSVSTLMVLDEADLDLLQGLVRPAKLDRLNERDRLDALIQWDGRRKEAERVVEMIAAKVANQLGHAIGSALSHNS